MIQERARASGRGYYHCRKGQGRAGRGKKRQEGTRRRAERQVETKARGE